MPDLGKKFTCYNCGTKFYNLGKPEALCPKCGANQKNAKDDAPPPTPRPPRRQALMEPVPEESPAEFGEEGPAPEEEAASDDEDAAEEEPELRVKEREDEEEY
jgi:hypothetical protein